MSKRKMHGTGNYKWIAVALSGFVATGAFAVPVELIVNGEFETPTITATFVKTLNANVPGWSNSSGRIELWMEGVLGSPPLGTDSVATGQHLELTTDSGNEVVSQTFTVPCCAAPMATFNFDGWPRDGQLVNYAFDGTLSGINFFQGAIYVGNMSNQWIDYATVWTNMQVPVTACEDITLRFWSSGAPGNGDGGTHIDQVSFVVECEDPLGACCLPDGTCDVLTQVECCTANGVYEGDGEVCQGDEACCLPDGGCEVMDKTCCEEEFGGQAQGPGSVCLGDANLNGIDDVCEPIGACCLPWGACAVGTPFDCAKKQGTYLGDNTQCAGDEACCMPDGGCSLADNVCCATELGGTPAGPGTGCAGDGDMNGIDDSCECHAIDNGTSTPDCVGTCPDPGVLCELDATGMSCECVSIELMGGCCLADGVCTVTTLLDCDAQAGTYLGDNTLCAGDTDGNGVDDACECGVVLGPAGPVCGGACTDPMPPTAECQPTCVNFDPATGQVTITDCGCREQSACYVDTSVFPPQCAGTCPVPGTTCVGTKTPLADGTVDFCCNCPSDPLPGDCDANGKVTLGDYPQFKGCITGPGGGPVTQDCFCADLDADRDVDEMDYGWLQRVLVSP